MVARFFEFLKDDMEPQDLSRIAVLDSHFGFIIQFVQLVVLHLLLQSFLQEFIHALFFPEDVLDKEAATFV